MTFVVENIEQATQYTINDGGVEMKMDVSVTETTMVMEISESAIDAFARQEIESHKLNQNNPHNVSASQLPAGQDLTLIFNNALL
ncbi:hypothetical protein MG296_10560 [Flavobacteriaceae bacterium TK19130]|nr:hypothetical protein [Thermobacterium salinum]